MPGASEWCSMVVAVGTGACPTLVSSSLPLPLVGERDARLGPAVLPVTVAFDLIDSVVAGTPQLCARVVPWSSAHGSEAGHAGHSTYGKDGVDALVAINVGEKSTDVVVLLSLASGVGDVDLFAIAVHVGQRIRWRWRWRWRRHGGGRLQQSRQSGGAWRHRGWRVGCRERCRALCKPR